MSVFEKTLALAARDIEERDYAKWLSDFTQLPQHFH